MNLDLEVEVCRFYCWGYVVTEPNEANEESLARTDLLSSSLLTRPSWLRHCALSLVLPMRWVRCGVLQDLGQRGVLAERHAEKP